MTELDKKIKNQKLRLVLDKQKDTKYWWQCIDSLTHRKASNNEITEVFEHESLNMELAKGSAIQPNTTRQPPPPSFDLRNQTVPKLSAIGDEKSQRLLQDLKVSFTLSTGITGTF